jgi:hypothetical protein
MLKKFVRKLLKLLFKPILILKKLQELLLIQLFKTTSTHFLVLLLVT